VNIVHMKVTWTVLESARALAKSENWHCRACGSRRPDRYGMYMLNTLVLDCLKPIFNRFGTSPSSYPISNRISVHRPRCRLELSIPGDALP
jgi:hypothetical protein